MIGVSSVSDLSDLGYGFGIDGTEPGLHDVVAYEACLLFDEAAIVEDGEVGDATDVVTG